MHLDEFRLERFFSKHEFSAPYLMCCSDCESFTIQELLDLEGDSGWSSLANLRLCYTESRGDPELRQRISKMYHGIDEKEVLVTAGAEEAIFLFMNSILAPGDHAIIQHPCYQSLYEVARSIGCQVTKWEMREEQGWRPDLDFLAGSVRNNTRLIVINNPHNPTGYLMSNAELTSILELTEKNGIILFSDEVYRLLEYEEQDRLKPACELYDNAVSLGVMSKSYGLAGLRIGWVATRSRDIYNRMASCKDYTSICCSAPSELLGNIALKHQDRLLQRNLKIIRHNLGVLDDFFEQHRGIFNWIRPKAGPIAFPGLRLSGSVDDFCARLLEVKGVLLLPGTCYQHASKNFRVGFGRQNLQECISKLEEYLESIR